MTPLTSHSQVAYGFSLYLLLSIISCQQSMTPSINVQGHRGCRGLYPENTLAGFAYACDLGVTTLEMDVVISADSQVVVSHEPFFNHEISTKPSGEVVKESEELGLNLYKMSYEEIQSYDVGLKPHGRFPHQVKVAAIKPLLKDVISQAESFGKAHHRDIKFNIEIKYKEQGKDIYHPQASQFVELLMQVLITAGVEDKTSIQCFDHTVLRVLHSKYPEQATVMLVEDTLSPTFHLEKIGFIPTVYSPYFELVDKNLVNFCKEKRMLLIPWTVNKESEVEKLLSLGVDGIITDYPDMLIELLMAKGIGINP